MHIEFCVNGIIMVVSEKWSVWPLLFSLLSKGLGFFSGRWMWHKIGPLQKKVSEEVERTDGRVLEDLRKQELIRKLWGGKFIQSNERRGYEWLAERDKQERSEAMKTSWNKWKVEKINISSRPSAWHTEGPTFNPWHVQLKNFRSRWHRRPVPDIPERRCKSW